MSRPVVVATAVGILAALVLLGAALWAPIEVRHSAPFGFNLTFDADRRIAVRGGSVTPNYPDFNRLDLDLRAYDLSATYDLTIHVRPDLAGATDLRTVSLSLSGERIRHDKAPFADPFVTVRFAPIANSAGRRYYVWVEPGPRNRDDVVTLWSIKSYSRSTGRAVLTALLRDPPGDGAPVLVRSALATLLLGLVAAFGWLMAAVTGLAFPGGGDPRPARALRMASAGSRWYTLGRPARRNPRRAVTFGTSASQRPRLGRSR